MLSITTLREHVLYARLHAGDGASEMRDVVLVRKPDSDERAGL